ncbi:MAG: helix-turn-helix domain-containing protein [Burkholderiales bacterium]
MARVRKIETFLSPRDAKRLTRLPSSVLARLVRRGTLTQYRTLGGHRRFPLSELRALAEMGRKHASA